MLAGTGDVLAELVAAAKEAVIDKYKAIAASRALSAGELADMKLELEQAQWGAVVAHIVANATVVVASVAGVTPGGGVSGPGAGAIT